jgi:branched-chain amino acid transport system substrate-binding protein
MTRSLILIVALSITALVQSCNNAKINSLKIVVIGAETGDYAENGKAQKKGIQIAIDEINNKGLLRDGKKIEAIFYDSKSDAKTAVSALQKGISSDHCKIFIGDVASGLTIPLVPIIQQRGCFLFSTWAGSSLLDSTKGNFARNYPSASKEGKFAADYVIGKMNKKRIAVIYVNNSWGNCLDSVFCSRVSKLSGNICLNESCSEDQTNFSTQIAKIKSVDPEIVYLAGYETDMGNFVKQFKEQGSNSEIIANTCFLDSTCLNIAKNSAENVLVASPYFQLTNAGSKLQTLFIQKHSKLFGKLPIKQIEANAFDAMMLVVQACNQVGYDEQKISAFIRDYKDFEGASGKYSFTEGNVDFPYSVEQITSNGIKILFHEDNSFIPFFPVIITKTKITP